MSNPLSVRRVKIQTIDADGNPDGEPTYGVLAADNTIQIYNDSYQSLERLNAEIEDQECILGAIPDWEEYFEFADTVKIGKNNFYGKDWQFDDPDALPEDDEEPASEEPTEVVVEMQKANAEADAKHQAWKAEYKLWREYALHFQKHHGHLPLVLHQEVYQFFGERVKIIEANVFDKPENAEVTIEGGFAEQKVIQFSELELEYIHGIC